MTGNKNIESEMEMMETKCGLNFKGLKCIENCKECVDKMGIQCHGCSELKNGKCTRYNGRCWMVKSEGEY